MSINSRTKGHSAERAVAQWLRLNGYPDARTSRSALGRDGFVQPGDVLGVPGLSIEVKNRRDLNIGESLLQARRQAEDGELGLVLVKPYRIIDVSQWWAIAYFGELLPCLNFPSSTTH